MMDSETLNEIQALKAMAKRADARIDSLAEYASALHRRVDSVTPAIDPLPAPALTEQAIVEALVRAPGMTGRILAAISLKLGQQGTMSVGMAAGDACRRSDDTLAYSALQSLAVALAAASYRG